MLCHAMVSDNVMPGQTESGGPGKIAFASPVKIAVRRFLFELKREQKKQTTKGARTLESLSNIKDSWPGSQAHRSCCVPKCTECLLCKLGFPQLQPNTTA